MRDEVVGFGVGVAGGGKVHGLNDLKSRLSGCQMEKFPYLFIRHAVS